MYKAYIKTFYFFVNPFRKLYWFVVRPKTRGVTCVIEHNGRFLITRPGYSHGKWIFPGGGVKKHETPEEAVRREIFEEVGITLKDPKKILEYTQDKEYKVDTVTVFHSIVLSPDFKIDGIEVVEADWFLSKELPINRVPRVDSLLSVLAGEKFQL